MLSGLGYLRARHGAAWTIWPAGIVAALFGWRLAWHIWMYGAMEYGGSATPGWELARAETRYRIGAVVLVVLSAAGAIYFLRRAG